VGESGSHSGLNVKSHASALKYRSFCAYLPRTLTASLLTSLSRSGCLSSGGISTGSARGDAMPRVPMTPLSEAGASRQADRLLKGTMLPLNAVPAVRGPKLCSTVGLAC
jgi:hypothetical protein